MRSKRHFDKVLKEVTCNLWKVLNKSVRSITKVLKVLETVRKSPHQKTCSMQKPANQPAMQINWLVATQHELKTKRDFRTDQNINNTCNFIIQ